MLEAKPLEFNVCTAADSYKFGHWGMIPPGTNYMSAYMESRLGAKFPYTLFNNLQYMVKSKFVGQIVTKEKIDRAMARVNAHIAPGCFNDQGWNRMLTKWGGRLPITIKAVPEGMCVPIGNVLMQINSNDEQCPWASNYVETVLTNIWSPCTVATQSRELKVMMKKFLDETSDNPFALDFMLHDFGMRGASSFETGATAGFGHIINFMGTDTFSAVELAMDYYNADVMPAFSVFATEHMIMTAEGRDGEMNVVDRLLNDYPIGILAMVIDSYNHKEFIPNVYKLFKDRILNRPDVLDPNGNLIQPGKIVFRPDSGDPVKTSLEVFGLLADCFGFTVNSKGYKILNPKVGMLWGDGIGPNGIRDILQAFKDAKISACNIVFGMGGGLLQKVNRDDQRFATKCSYIEVDGIGRDVFKDPIASFGGSKKSKAGRLVLIQGPNGIETMRLDDYNVAENGQDLLEDVFVNGELVRDMSLDQIRANAAI